jgi:hypothetical protein
MMFLVCQECALTTAQTKPWFLAVSIEATSLNMALLQRDQLKIKELRTAKMVQWMYFQTQMVASGSIILCVYKV